MAYVIVWEFVVHAATRSEFEALYGPQGVWAKLFASSPSFLGTRLLRETRDSSRYLTLDRWQDRDVYEDFLRRHLSEYRDLDARCSSLTLRESPLGCFEEVE
ncbi:MAG TPA: antibiotic biosynthesis monooxygenase [Candidatus Polarisedimenticolia bacterium]|nr:antibiotic biosynthesis monooxygenase [Candidatus Polarisedimenticolia bacterium]